ncbi:NUDIX hydrolase [Alteribacter populi]|uniref:NUDIX hydrolase n=1 Tax=Alteribacter populi TaxID=2011011 RepID=UPI000BBA4C9E|nr:NUDIX domain-containing protein [Alteribacter populi]
MFIVNVEGAVFHNGKWLIIKRSAKEDHGPGMLSLVGGKAEREGNTTDILERTLKREIEEEVGIRVKEGMHYVHNTSFVSDTGIHVVDIVFLCEYESGIAHPKSHEEVAGVYWMAYEEILNHRYVPIWPKNSIRYAEAVRKKLKAEVNK